MASLLLLALPDQERGALTPALPHQPRWPASVERHAFRPDTTRVKIRYTTRVRIVHEQVQTIHEPGLKSITTRVGIRTRPRVRIRTRPGFESVHDPGSNPYTTRVRIRTRPGFESVHDPGSNPYTTRARIRTRPGFESALRGNSWSFPPGRKTTPPSHHKKTKIVCSPRLEGCWGRRAASPCASREERETSSLAAAGASPRVPDARGPAVAPFRRYAPSLPAHLVRR